MGKTRAHLLNLSLVAAGLLAACLLFELAVRIFDPQPASLYRFSPDTYYEPVPGARFVYRTREFAVPVEFNEFGMRDVARRIEKPAGGVRVALLGDSFVEALQVPLDSTLARRLEVALARRFPGRPVEVLNFGVSGFGTAAEAVRYRTLASRFNPDLVMVVFVENDPWDVVGNDARLYQLRDGRMDLQRVELSRARRLLLPPLELAKHHLHAYRFLRYRMMRVQQARARREASARAAAAGTAEPLPGPEAWLRVRQALELLLDSVTQDGARLLVVQAATRGPDMDTHLAGICADLGIAFHTLVPALAADSGPILFQIDGHWRPLGHRIAAREIYPAVAEMLGSPPEPATPASP
jgi:lysophospholipase L1-like esterase